MQTLTENPQYHLASTISRKVCLDRFLRDVILSNDILELCERESGVILVESATSLIIMSLKDRYASLTPTMVLHWLETLGDEYWFSSLNDLLSSYFDCGTSDDQGEDSREFGGLRLNKDGAESFVIFDESLLLDIARFRIPEWLQELETAFLYASHVVGQPMSAGDLHHLLLLRWGLVST